MADANYHSDPDDPDYISPEKEIDLMNKEADLSFLETIDTRENSESSEDEIDNEDKWSFRYLLENWLEIKRPLKLEELEKLRDDLIHHLSQVQHTVKNWKRYNNRYK